MALDVANSDASSVTVRVSVLFYLFVATDDTSSSSARTPAINGKEKFNVPLSDDLFNFVKHLETFTGLAEIVESKGLGDTPEVTMAISCSFVILSYTNLFLLLQKP